jgi:hypothetical protein
MPNKEQYNRQAQSRKLRALAEYEKRRSELPKLENAQRLCERCIRLEQMRKKDRMEKYNVKIEFKEVIVDWK